MKIKVSEATPLQLNWLVEFIRGGYKAEPGANYWLEMWRDPTRRINCDHPSTKWAQGGPIIEREEIRIAPDGRNNFTDRPPITWGAAKYWPDGRSEWYFGPTPLIAAMRCYVASKLDEEVEVPEELT